MEHNIKCKNCTHFHLSDNMCMTRTKTKVLKPKFYLSGHIGYMFDIDNSEHEYIYNTCSCVYYPTKNK